MTSSAANVAAAQATDLVAGTSLWADAWKRLRRNRMAVASGGVLLVLALACLAGPGLILREVFRITGLDKQLPIHADVISAVGAFAQ